MTVDAYFLSSFGLTIKFIFLKKKLKKKHTFLQILFRNV